MSVTVPNNDLKKKKVNLRSDMYILWHRYGDENKVSMESLSKAHHPEEILSLDFIMH